MPLHLAAQRWATSRLARRRAAPTIDVALRRRRATATSSPRSWRGPRRRLQPRRVDLRPLLLRRAARVRHHQRRGHAERALAPRAHERRRADACRCRSSEVYGTAQYTPIDERHPLHAQCPYAASKVGADKLAESFHLSFGLPVVIARPFNTYGPRQSLRAVIPTVIAQALGRRRPHARLARRRRATSSSWRHRRRPDRARRARRGRGGTYNIATGKDISVGDVVEIVGELLGRELDGPHRRPAPAPRAQRGPPAARRRREAARGHRLGTGHVAARRAAGGHRLDAHDRAPGPERLLRRLRPRCTP